MFMLLFKLENMIKSVDIFNLYYLIRKTSEEACNRGFQDTSGRPVIEI